MNIDARTIRTKKLAWKLRLVMVTKGINTASELKRRLYRYGYDITTTHAARIVNMLPQRISTELFEALVNVLDCSPGDLLVTETVVDENTTDVVPPVTTSRSDEKKSSGGKIRKLPLSTKVVAVDDDSDYFGPMARTLPKPTFDETPDK